MNKDYADKTSDSVNSSVSSRRIPELDGLRGLAIVLVLFYHSFELARYDGNNFFVQLIFSVSRFGASGVSLFFVLSGFLIGGILIDNKDAFNYFKVFYIRRSLRIFPLYYSFLIVYIIFVYARLCGVVNFPEWLFGFDLTKLSYLTLTQNFLMVKSKTLDHQALSPTWTLAVEEQFYLTLPLIIRFISRKHLLTVLASIEALVVLTKVFMKISGSWDPYYIFLMPFRIDAFIFGVIAAIFLRSDKMKNWLRSRHNQYFVILPALVVMTFISDNYPLYVLLLLWTLLAKPESIIRKIFRHRVLCKIGVLSYCIYLIHMGILAFVHWQLAIENKAPLGRFWLLEIGLGLSITFIIAKLSWRYFEKPIINYAHNFQYRIKSSNC